VAHSHFDFIMLVTWEGGGKNVPDDIMGVGAKKFSWAYRLGGGKKNF